MIGSVYLIESTTGQFKIGFTKNDPRRRLAMLRTGNADDLSLVGTVAGTMDDEKELHRLLRPWRVSREWYAQCPAIDYLAERVSPVVEGRAVGDHPLAHARVAAGLSQTELAKAVGLCRVSVARIEGRAQEPPLPTVSKIIGALKAYGVELSADAFLPAPAEGQAA